MAEISSRILMITPRIDYIRELVKPEHQLFHHRIDSCSYNLNRHQLSEILIRNMFHYEGIGLSANQIGIWERAFAMIRDIEHNEVIVCFNDTWIETYHYFVMFNIPHHRKCSFPNANLISRYSNTVIMNHIFYQCF